MNNIEYKYTGPGILDLLGLLFIALKLMGHIAWSWWLVLLPIYLLPLSALIVILVILIGGLLSRLVDYIIYKTRSN